MVSDEEIKQAEKTGQYQFPFKHSNIADCVRDFTKTFSEFIENEENHYAMEYMGKKHKYSLVELISTWRCVEVQRLHLKAILKVVNGEYIAINPAIRSYKKEFNKLGIEY